MDKNTVIEKVRGSALEALNLAEYFEDGCLCISSGRIAKQDSSQANANAANYYMENCTCTRHPESAHRYCWDHERNFKR